MSFKIVKGDIFKQEVDAIVLTTATTLPIRGVLGDKMKEICGDKAIQCVKAELEQMKNPSITQCVITNAYNLPCKRLIHAVTPRWHSDLPKKQEQQRMYLEDTYTNCLNLAETFGLKSIAFPLLSAGVYQYPKDIAAEVALEMLSKRANENDNIDISLVIFSQDTWDKCKDKFEAFGVTEEELSQTIDEELKIRIRQFKSTNEYKAEAEAELLKNEDDDIKTIGEKLRHFIKMKNRSHFDCYNGVIGKTAFGNIVCKGDSTRKKSIPNKETLIALGINIRLNEAEINELLKPIGEAIRKYENGRDKIIFDKLVEFDQKYKKNDKDFGYYCLKAINKELEKEYGNPLYPFRKKKKATL